MEHRRFDARPETAWPLLLWLWLCWACVGTWLREPDYAHGFFIPLLAVYFSRERWFRFKSGGTKLSWNLLPWLAVPLIFLLEWIRLAPMPWRLPLWLIYAVAASGTIWTVVRFSGRKGLTVSLFPVAFMALAVPWPVAVEIPVSQLLGGWIAQAAAWGLTLVGLACHVQGRIIEVARGTLGVEDACSGIRSLHTGIVLALALGEWRRLRTTARIGLLALSIIGALFLNILRTAFLAGGTAFHGPTFVETWHDPAAWIALAILSAGLFYLSYIWRIIDIQIQTPEPDQIGTRRKTFGPITAASLAVLLLAHVWYAGEPALSLKPLNPSDFRPDLSIVPVPPPASEILRADRAVFLRPPPPNDAQNLGYHLVWLSNDGFSLVHRPDVCLPGGGWTPVGKPVIIPTTVANRPALAMGFVFQRGGKQMNLYWMAWMQGRPVTPSLQTGQALQARLLPDLIRARQRKVTVEVIGLAHFQAGSPCGSGELAQLLETFGLTPP